MFPAAPLISAHISDQLYQQNTAAITKHKNSDEQMSFPYFFSLLPTLTHIPPDCKQPPLYDDPG